MKDLPIGVHYSKGGRFRAVIRVSGKQYHLGTFADVETATTVRQQAKKMADDLVGKLGKTEYVEVEVVKFITLPSEQRQSIWRRFLNSWNRAA